MNQVCGGIQRHAVVAAIKMRGDQGSAIRKRKNENKFQIHIPILHPLTRLE
jgi:hypothetical protein